MRSSFPGPGARPDAPQLSLGLAAILLACSLLSASEALHEAWHAHDAQPCTSHCVLSLLAGHGAVPPDTGSSLALGPPDFPAREVLASLPAPKPPARGAPRGRGPPAASAASLPRG